MTLDGPIDVVVNAIAGSAECTAFVDELRNLVNHDSRWRIAIAFSGPELQRLVDRAVKSDSQIVVAAAGDGTVNTVANRLVGTSKALGVLPLGTLNHFAKDLHLPLNLEDAVATIAEGNAIEVDTADVNGHKFVNNSSLGLYPHIVTERQKRQRLLGWGKWPAFLWAAWSVLKRYPFVEVRLIADGRSFRRRTPLVFIGNNRYEMEGLNIGARASLQEHQLSLYTTNQTNRIGLVVLALRALFKRLRMDNDFLEVCTTEIWINTRHRHLRVALDGEVTVLIPPLHYTILPHSLRVIVPRESKVQSA